MYGCTEGYPGQQTDSKPAHTGLANAEPIQADELDPGTRAQEGLGETRLAIDGPVREEGIIYDRSDSGAAMISAMQILPW